MNDSKSSQVMDAEYRARGISVPEQDAGAKQYEADLRAVASTAEGRRVLHHMITSHKFSCAGFTAEATLFAATVRMPGEKLENDLRRILPRETFLEILYPHEEEK